MSLQDFIQDGARASMAAWTFALFEFVEGALPPLSEIGPQRTASASSFVESHSLVSGFPTHVGPYAPYSRA